MRFLLVDQLDEAQQARTRAIYESGFPPELRQDFDALVAEDDARAYLDGPDPVGFVVLRAMTEPGWAFLRYFVVGERGRGLGSRMWRDLLADGEIARLVLDVEDPDEPGLDEAELEERRRRIVFYERLGARVVPVIDYHPPHGDALGGLEPALRLLVSDVVTDADDAERIVVAAYRDRYGLDATHPAVVATLATLGTPGTMDR